MDTTQARAQLISLFLIILACTAIGVGSKFGWHELTSFGIAFGGGGLGILTGHQIASGDSAK